MTREPNREVLNKWFADRGDITHRLNYDLDSNSTVLDVGGYKGDWVNSIHKKFGSTVHVFEPVNKFYELIVNRFKDYPQIVVHKFGLCNVEGSVDIFIDNDASSTFRGSVPENIKMKPLLEFLNQHEIDFVDLMKVNIEGGEYDLLEDIINRDYQNRFGNLQIQFHMFVDNCEVRREAIRKALSKTHKLTYNYEFVWENWVLK